MTNTKTRKTSGTCKDAVHVNNSTVLSGGENNEPTNETDGGHWMEVTDNECLAGNGASYSNSDEDTEDADEIVNDGDTSTSFSLEECMNEFRARRIRRTSLSLHRQENEKSGTKSGKNCQETTEIDLINQNLCNKEQERKCKPCQNGFCYCFTSDSGEGGSNLGGCIVTRGMQARNSRRNRRSECSQFSSTTKGHAKSLKSKERIKEDTSHLCKYPGSKTDANCVKSTMTARNQLTAISSLETSTKDAPLIHIIQELRDNCVISKVKVNKHKIQPFKTQNNKSLNGKDIHGITQKNNHSKDQMKSKKLNITYKRSLHRSAPEKFTPTAPTLEKLSELEIPQSADGKSLPLETNKKCSECNERRRYAGGQLLQKRLSISQFSYKPRIIKHAPSKPPRSSLIYDDKYCGSSLSTSPSVREAERVVDIFLKKQAFTATATTNNDTKSIKSKKVECVKRKSYPMSKLS